MSKDALIMLSMRVAGTFFWMAYTVVLARTLTTAEFASALYIINFSLVAVLIITMGRDVSLLRIASKAWGTPSAGSIRGLLSRARLTILISGTLFTASMLLLALVGLDIPVTRTTTVALLTGLITVAAAQMGLNRDCLRAVGQVWQSQLGFNLIRTIIPILGTIVVFYLGQMTLNISLALFLASLCVSWLVEELLLRRVRFGALGQEPLTENPRLLSGSIFIWPGDISNAVQMRIAGLLAGAILQPETAALFLAAERIANLAQFPIAAASQAAAPRIARSATQGPDPLQSELNTGSALMLIGACLGVFGAIGIALPALWAIGPDFTAAFPIALLLISAHFSWALFGLAQPSLHLTGRFRSYSTIAVSACAITFVSIYLGTKYADGVGTAVAYCVGWWLTNITYTLAFRIQTGHRTGIFALKLTTFLELISRKGRQS